MTIWLVRHGQSAHNAIGLRHRREDVALSTLGIQQAAAIRIPGRPTHRLLATTARLPDVRGRRRGGGEDAGGPVDGDVVAVTHAGVMKGLLGLAETPPNGSVHRWR